MRSKNVYKYVSHLKAKSEWQICLWLLENMESAGVKMCLVMASVIACTCSELKEGKVGGTCSVQAAEPSAWVEWQQPLLWLAFTWTKCIQEALLCKLWVLAIFYVHMTANKVPGCVIQDPRSETLRWETRQCEAHLESEIFVLNRHSYLCLLQNCYGLAKNCIYGWLSKYALTCEILSALKKTFRAE